MLDASGRRMIGSIATGILLLTLHYVSQSIFAPLIFFPFVIALVWPCQAMLQRWLPKLLALLIRLIVTMVVMVSIGSCVAWGFGKLAQWHLSTLSASRRSMSTEQIDWKGMASRSRARWLIASM
jgi:predicted PurR-regulated permease PerM